MKRGSLILTAMAAILGVTIVSAQTEQADTSKPAPIKAEPAASAALLTVDVKICSAIEERQPVGVADCFDAGVEQVYLWSKISGAADSTSVTHVWLFEGKEIATVELPVKSSSWRTWSSKKMLPARTGEWEARVVGPDGVIMATTRFVIAPTAPVEDETKE